MKPSKKLSVAVPSVEVNHNQLSFNLLQCCALTGLNLWQIRSAIWAGHLNAKKRGRNLIVLKADLEAFTAAAPAYEVKASTKEWLSERITGVKP